MCAAGRIRGLLVLCVLGALLFASPSALAADPGPPQAVTNSAGAEFPYPRVPLPPADVTADLYGFFVGHVWPSGTDTTVWFEWGRTTAYGSTTTERRVAPDGSGWGLADGDGSFQVPDSTPQPLERGATYHARLVARNDYGTALGGDIVFTVPRLPDATTGPATALTESGATLNGTVGPIGDNLSYWFDYGTTTAYGSRVFPAGRNLYSPLLIGAPNVALPISGLLPNTTYHYRFGASGGLGNAAYGADATFTTALDAATAATINPTHPTAGKLFVPRQRLRTALRRGFRTSVKCLATCSVVSSLAITHATAKRLHIAGRRVVARGATTSQPGTAELTLKFNRKAKRQLGHARRVRLLLSVSLRDAAGAGAGNQTYRTHVTLAR